MGKKHKAIKASSIIDTEIAVLEEQVETVYASLLLDGLGPDDLRFVAIFTVLADYAAHRTPFNALLALPELGMPGAGIGLLTTIWGYKTCRVLKTMLTRWQTGTPEQQSDLRTFLNGVIPPRGIRLVNPDGTYQEITRGAFARGGV